ncbi:RNA pyrophosphohydrolase [Inmirania thermothiophila]|uniref:RNA pyrophosphohydrolase n=1 Tax=Inmirania thermothiophila TaxID=1750597 RepID=A0A3N1Y8Y4_9GAMM|nr:RNA pyrophosphohydrolase [Inmirania thermothiophila]ROR35001.1 putative (di)nucleoside polyphosphate hydrolase [Inmirania thermothiophila]
MIDEQGFRLNVGMILVNAERRLLWARRIGRDAWQFPQGGIAPGETPEEAMYRELGEELGLGPAHVEILACSRDWLRYRLPVRFRRRNSHPPCVGQKQRWFLLRFRGHDEDVRLNLSPKPEFDRWRWVGYWEPVREVIFFKREVYRLALREFAPLLFPEGAVPAEPRRRRGAGARRRRRR